MMIFYFLIFLHALFGNLLIYLYQYGFIDILFFNFFFFLLSVSAIATMGLRPFWIVSYLLFKYRIYFCFCTFSLHGAIRYARFILHFPCPILWISYFFKGPVSFRKQDLGELIASGVLLLLGNHNTLTGVCVCGSISVPVYMHVNINMS